MLIEYNVSENRHQIENIRAASRSLDEGIRHAFSGMGAGSRSVFDVRERIQTPPRSSVFIRLTDQEFDLFSDGGLHFPPLEALRQALSSEVALLALLEGRYNVADRFPDPRRPFKIIGHQFFDGSRKVKGCRFDFAGGNSFFLSEEEVRLQFVKEVGAALSALRLFPETVEVTYRETGGLTGESGPTAYPTTLPEVISKLKERFGLKA